ncbi:MAG: peptidyl-prolyl cis-trans isomerase [Candidatus Pacearchaeota archaeon]|nr:peptidyl-prolyl cis-trans isomerase [Candidatus Pacearchaeota archaeon]
MANKARASHILVKTEEQAKEILRKLNLGESFEKLAQEFSLCPSRKRGGSLGEFGRGQMVREFEKAVFSAKKGQIIGPVKTQFGWHIIRVEDSWG